MEHHQPNRISTLQQFSEAQSVPTEIAVEILLKLPVESLLRCKSVCKSWYSLISDPQFVKSHLAISTRSNSQYAHHRLIFSTERRTRIESCHLHHVLYDNNSINNALDLDYPFKHLSKLVSVVGSCNGLVCIAVYRSALFIWNPSTRKSHRLPPSDYEKHIGLFALHGFGYQQSTGDYKVVEIFPKLKSRETLVRIYSSKDGNWKEMGVYPRVFSFFDFGKFSNGALHWIAANDLGGRIIVALDLEKETYGEVLQPDYDAGYKHFILGSLRE
ncbi:F-box/kelch-repeat protein At3g23880-like [Bidens hawaiensis]|uniref:F-box/kelch-repeat protein At3g23880-like n=1 Tax=Bidens hawaiensis TaxID=980011 RepID=UPI00404B0E2C